MKIEPWFGPGKMGVVVNPGSINRLSRCRKMRCQIGRRISVSIRPSPDGQYGNRQSTPIIAHRTVLPVLIPTLMRDPRQQR